jgi:hypothetical protein
VFVAITSSDLTNDSTPTITGTTDAGAIIFVEAGGAVYFVVVGPDGTTWSATSTDELAEGDHIVTAIATDSLGNSGTATQMLTFEIDTDGDGIPDVFDTDDDGDGISDADEAATGTDPLVPNPADTDTDGDGKTDADESDETSSIITDTNNNGISDANEALADFTPSVEIDSFVFVSAGDSRDFVVNLAEIIGGPSVGQVVLKLSIPEAFNISYVDTDIGADVNGGISVNNSDWDITVGPSFITMTLKLGVIISADTFSRIGFTIERKPGIPAQTSEPITVTIVEGSGSDSNISSDTINIVVLAQ